MSVLSVGMGNSDQKALEELKRLHSSQASKQIANEPSNNRNLFHYFKYNQIKGNEEELALATFREIPRQFLEYTKMKNIQNKKTSESKNK